MSARIRLADLQTCHIPTLIAYLISLLQLFKQASKRRQRFWLERLELRLQAAA